MRDSNKCIECGAAAKMKDSDYCYWHNPAISDAQKKEARARGGRQNRKIEHSISSEDVLPIRTVGDLKAYLNLLLGESIDGIEDVKELTRTTLPIVDKFNEIFQVELVEQMTLRLELLEAKQVGRLTDGKYEYSGDS